MRTRSPFRVAAAAATFALVVTACGGGEEPQGEGPAPTDEETTETEPEATEEQTQEATGGTYSAAITEPSYLAPFSNCYESECAQVLEMILDPLVSIAEEGEDGGLQQGELIFDGLAESIESNEDNTVWTVTLKPDRQFHNGEPVNADAFVRAWEYSANPKNAQATAGFLSRIVGAGSKGGALRGIKKLDDLTFEVRLNGPFSQFGHMLAYTPAFHPLAQECVDDLDACNQQPIGTGPYQMDGKWRHNEGITVTKWEDYGGEQPANADTIEFQMYGSPTAEFRAFQNGGLDVLSIAPEVYLEAKQQLGEDLIEQPTATLTYLGFPTKVEPYDQKEVRQAISMAINRQLIIDQVLNGLALPSTDIVTPPIPGSRDDACEFCRYDVEAAKQLIENADVPDNFTMQLYFNADAGHELWTEAAARQVQDAFGWDYQLQSTEWAQYLELLDAQDFKGPFRLGWSLDYPSPENYIRPLVGCEGDSNYSAYCNPELDDLLTQGDQSPTLEQSFELYQQAGDIALEEMPIVPLWSGVTAIASSDQVENVRFDVGEGEIAFGEVTVAGQ